MRYSIICATNRDDKLKSCLLTSPDLDNHQLVIMHNYSNVPKAYNDAIEQASEPITIFLHDDVVLPKGFFDQLTSSINSLEKENWGILGVAGYQNHKQYGYLESQKKLWGNINLVPHEVDTLDEVLLVTKHGNFLFDENIPSTHHMFGADICMQAKEQNQKNFAILAYCLHNSDNNFGCIGYPKDFYDSVDYIKQKWSKYLPFRTTSVLVK